MSDKILFSGVSNVATSILTVLNEAKKYFEKGEIFTVRITNYMSSAVIKMKEFKNNDSSNTTVGILPPLFIESKTTADATFCASNFFTSNISLTWFIQESKEDISPSYYVAVDYLWRKKNKGTITVELVDLGMSKEEQAKISPITKNFYQAATINYSAFQYQIFFAAAGNTVELVFMDNIQE